MRFIYDIVVNYENNFFEFYEWEKEDNIIKLIVLCYDKPFGMSRKYKHLRKMFRDYNKDSLV